MGAAFSPLRSDRESGVSAGVRHHLKEDAGGHLRDGRCGD